MSDIFREVDEALQREKMLKIWEEYRSTIIAAIAILILSTALTTAYKSWDASRDANETARLMDAMQSENPQASIQQVIKDTRNGHEALGRMSTAGLLLEEDKTAEAAELYKQVAEDGSAPKDFRDLARILYNQHTPTPSLDMLKPLLANEKSPWIWHARLQAATIAGQKNKDYAQALAYLKPFEDVTTIPLSLKQRAQAVAHVYELKQEDGLPTQTPAAGQTTSPKVE